MYSTFHVQRNKTRDDDVFVTPKTTIFHRFELLLGNERHGIFKHVKIQSLVEDLFINNYFFNIFNIVILFFPEIIAIFGTRY